MFSYFKLFLFAIIAAAASYAGLNFYRYYTVDTAPTVEVVDLDPGRSFAGEAIFRVKGTDEYKVSRLKVSLDGKPMIDEKVNRRSFERPVVIDTLKMDDGKHDLAIEIAGGARQGKKANIDVAFMVDNQPLQVAYVKNENDARVAQGRTLHVQFQANKELGQAVAKVFAKEYPCFLESNRGFIYECFIPIDCEEVPKEYLLMIDVKDKAGNKAELQGKFVVETFPFKKQALRIDPDKIKKENDEGAPDKQFELEVEALTKKSPAKKLWHGQFVMPLEYKDAKQITSEFGVIRATQERGLRQHKALDLYAMPKSVVWAPQDGIVVMKARYAHSGNTVIIDHGYGILSMFFHLDTFAPIEVGEAIKKGNPVGTLGKTGYATGYHLHWELRIGDVPVDPMEWTKPGF